MHAIIGAYALLATSVCAMAAVMYAESDPDGSLAQVLATGGFAVLLLVRVSLLPAERARGVR